MLSCPLTALFSSSFLLWLEPYTALWRVWLYEVMKVGMINIRVICWAGLGLPFWKQMRSYNFFVGEEKWGVEKHRLNLRLCSLPVAHNKGKEISQEIQTRSPWDKMHLVPVAFGRAKMILSFSRHSALCRLWSKLRPCLVWSFTCQTTSGCHRGWFWLLFPLHLSTECIIRS